MRNKFEGFPPAYFLTLEDAKDRQKEMYRQFDKFGIENVTMVFGYDSRKEDFQNNHPLVSGSYFSQMNSCDIAITIGHLKMIKQWYENSDSEYAIFFEDDVNLEISEHWTFDWQDVISILPNDWKVIQMSLIRNEIGDIRLHVRPTMSWSVTAYMIRRDYARHLIWEFFNEEKFNIRLLGDPRAIPYVEDCVYFPAEPNGYVLPIFVEKLNSISYFYPKYSNDPIKEANAISSERVHNWWVQNGRNVTIDDLRIK